MLTILRALSSCTVRGHDPVRRVTAVESLPLGGYRVSAFDHWCHRCDTRLDHGPTTGRPRIAIECGQRLWRPACWRRPWLRRFPAGFALGPIMVWPHGWEVRRG